MGSLVTLGDIFAQVCHELKTEQNESNQSRSSNSRTEISKYGGNSKMFRVGKWGWYDSLYYCNLIFDFLLNG